MRAANVIDLPKPACHMTSFTGGLMSRDWQKQIPEGGGSSAPHLAILRSFAANTRLGIYSPLVRLALAFLFSLIIFMILYLIF